MESLSPEAVLLETLRSHFHSVCSAFGTYIAAPEKDPLALPLVASVTLNVVLLCLVLCILPRRPAGAQAASKANGAAAPKVNGTYTAKRSERKKRDPPVITSVAAAIDELKALSDGYKYLEAGELLDALRKELSSSGGAGRRDSWGSWGAADASQQLEALLKDGKVEENIRMCRGALRDLNSDEGFELVKQDATMKVLQRFTAERHMTVKIEAVLDGVRADQCMMIWREAALYPQWFPFITGGSMLSEQHAADVILHLLVETFFMSVDMVLWGKLCDNLSEGQFLACVRPIKADTRTPPGVVIPPTGEGVTRKSLFGSMRADAVIDILVEPLEGGQVRFAFQMSDTLPPFIPSWAINYVVQNAMVQIFDKMAEVASAMANKDPSSLHLRHVHRPAYAATKAWIEERFGTGGGAGGGADGGES